MIEQHPGRFAGLFVPQDFAAKRIRRFLLDLRDAQRRAVRDRGVAIGTSEEHRVVRRDLVEVIAGGELRRLPERLDPAAAGDPFPALRFRDPLLHFREKIFERVCAFEVQRQLALADPEDVAMRIRQAGHDGFSREIYGARAFGLIFFRVRVRADKNNSAAFHRDRFRARLAFVHRVDVAVHKNGFRGF